MVDPETDSQRAPESTAAAAAALRRKGRRMLAAWHAERAARPGCPNLFETERKLLAACGLPEMPAVRRRLQERALLAAYDGAPNALYDTQREQALDLPPGEANRNPARAASATLEVLLETSLRYDPDTGRVCARYAVTCRRRRELAGDTHNGICDTSDFYAVTFDARTGRVAWREYSINGQQTGCGTAQQVVAREPVAPAGR